MALSITLFQTIFNKKYVRQMLTYPDSAVRFIETLFLLAPLFYGEPELSENILQDSPPNWIIGFLEVYK